MPRILHLSATAGHDAGDISREAVDLELQNAIQLNDLLMIQDMIQVSSSVEMQKWKCRANPVYQETNDARAPCARTARTNFSHPCIHKAPLARLSVDAFAGQGGTVDSGLALARVAHVGGSEEMVQLLLQLGARPDASDEFGRTALMLAVTRRDKRMTEMLLAAGANCEGIGGACVCDEGMGGACVCVTRAWAVRVCV
jgi:hypothetical protein